MPPDYKQAERAGKILWALIGVIGLLVVVLLAIADCSDVRAAI